MKNSKKLNKETKNLIKAVVSVLIFFLLAICVDAAGSQWYLWAAWMACAFVWIGANRK